MKRMLRFDLMKMFKQTCSERILQRPVLFDSLVHQRFEFP